ncbi:MAG: hypothetical protein P1V97_09470 [Planctomycetota bacterium]|nr:hypothetical protein [Planctomycetota bacterium]
MSDTPPLPPRLVEVFGEEVIARARTEADAKNCRITDVLASWGHLPNQSSELAAESRYEAETKETVIQSGPPGGDASSETALLPNDPASNPTILVDDPSAVAVTLSAAFTDQSSTEWLTSVFKEKRYSLIKTIQGSDKDWSVALVLDTRFQRALCVQRYEDNENEAWSVAQALSQCCHPALPMIHDLGDFEGQKAAFANPLPEKTLKDKLDAHRSTVHEIADTLLPIAEALAESHKVGLAHSGINLESIRVGKFGELFLSGGPIDPLWKLHGHNDSESFGEDVLALGQVLRALMESHSRSSLAWPMEIRGILTKSAGSSYAAADFASDLRAFVEGRAIEGESWPLLAAMRRRARKNPRAAFVSFAVASLLTTLFIGLGFHTWQTQKNVKLAKLGAESSLSIAEMEQGRANQELKVAQLDTKRAVERAAIIRRLHSLQSKSGLRQLGDSGQTTETLKNDFEDLINQAEKLRSDSALSKGQERASSELLRQIRLARSQWALSREKSLAVLAEQDCRALLKDKPRDASAALMLYQSLNRQSGKEKDTIKFLDSLPDEKNSDFPILQWEAQLRPFERKYQVIREEVNAKAKLAQMKAFFGEVEPLSKKVRLAMKTHTESAMLAEIAGRLAVLQSGIGYQSAKTSRASHINIAIKRFNHAALLDSSLTPRLGTVCFQFNEKYGAHQSWRFMTGDFARRVIENPGALTNPEPILDLMDVYENILGFPQVLAFAEILTEQGLQPPLNPKEPQSQRYYSLCAVAKAACGMKVPAPWIDFLSRIESESALCATLKAVNAALDKDEGKALKLLEDACAGLQKPIDGNTLGRLIIVLSRGLCSRAIPVAIRQKMVQQLEKKLRKLHPYHEHSLVSSYLWVAFDSKSDFSKLLKRAQSLEAELRRRRLPFLYNTKTLTTLTTSQRLKFQSAKDKSRATIDFLRYTMLFNDFRHSEEFLIRACADFQAELKARGQLKAAEALSGFDPVRELWQRRKVVSPKLHLWTDGSGRIIGGSQ